MSFLYRCLKSIPVLFVISLIIFILPRLAEGDPAILLAGEFATEEQLATLRFTLGLDQPLWQQYLLWIVQILQGNFGWSIFYQMPIVELFLDRLEPTLLLATYTLVLSSLLGIPLGIYSAEHQGRWMDTLITGSSTLFFSVPVFITAIAMTWLFAYWIPLFPVQGYTYITEHFWQHLYQMCLPVLTLSLIYIPLIARITRSSMLAQAQMHYIRTARAKGLPHQRILYIHALKNAAIPIINVLSFIATLLLAGVVVTETIFEIPGIGSLVFQSILQRDFPVIQSITFLSAISYLFIFILLDSLYAAIDPRIHY